MNATVISHLDESELVKAIRIADKIDLICKSVSDRNDDTANAMTPADIRLHVLEQCLSNTLVHPAVEALSTVPPKQQDGAYVGPLPNCGHHIHLDSDQSHYESGCEWATARNAVAYLNMR